jgi:hypothetical protein
MKFFSRFIFLGLVFLASCSSVISFHDPNFLSAKGCGETPEVAREKALQALVLQLDVKVRSVVTLDTSEENYNSHFYRNVSTSIVSDSKLYGVKYSKPTTSFFSKITCVNASLNRHMALSRLHRQAVTLRSDMSDLLNIDSKTNAERLSVLLQEQSVYTKLLSLETAAESLGSTLKVNSVPKSHLTFSVLGSFTPNPSPFFVEMGLHKVGPRNHPDFLVEGGSSVKPVLPPDDGSLYFFSKYTIKLYIVDTSTMETISVLDTSGVVPGYTQDQANTLAGEASLKTLRTTVMSIK